MDIPSDLFKALDGLQSAGLMHGLQMNTALFHDFGGLVIDGLLAGLAASSAQIKEINKLLARDADPVRLVFVNADERAALDRTVEEYRKAEKIYRHAQNSGDHTYSPENWSAVMYNFGVALANQGRLNYNTGLLREAEQVLFTALSIRTKDFWPAEWSKIMSDIGMVLLQQGVQKADISYLRRSESVLTEAYAEFISRNPDNKNYVINHDWDYSGRVCNNLGNVRRYLGEFTGDPAYLRAALKDYFLAHKIRSQGGSPIDVALTCNNIGITHRLLGVLTGDQSCYKNSIAAFKKALLDCPQHGEHLDRSTILNNYSEALLQVGSASPAKQYLHLAEKSLHQALRVRTVRRWPMHWVETQTRLGHVQLRLGSLNKDRRLVKEAIRTYQRALDPRAAQRSIWTRWIESPKAKDDPALAPTARADIHFGLGIAFGVLNAEADDPALLAEAEMAYRTALKIWEASDSEDNQQEVARLLARVLVASGRYEDAAGAIESTIRRSETAIADIGRSNAGRGRAVDRVSDLYSILSLCLLRQARPDLSRALIVAESGRARLLAAALALESVRVEDISDTNLRLEIEARRDRRAGLRVQLGYERIGPDILPWTMSAQERNRLHLEMQETTDALLALCQKYALTSTIEPLSFQEILLVLPKGGAFVLPVLTEHAAFALIVTESRTLEVIELADLDRRIVAAHLFVESGWVNVCNRHFREQKGKDPDASAAWHQQLTGTLAWLWERLLAPIHFHLRDVAHLAPNAPVVLLPPGLLGLLPLHAAGPGPDGRYFGDHWTVSYAPSVRSLMTCQARRDERASQPARLLAAIDPDGSLRGARAEGLMLRRGFTMQGREPIILTGEDATISRVLGALSGATVFHASTHGTHEWMDPAKSGLRLADGDLQFDMLRHARLDAMRLVFLSACESGLAGVRRLSEEFIGLPTALVEAGAAAVVGSLWPIGDVSAFLLASRFYGLMFDAAGQERMAPATALQEACAWLRNVNFGELKQQFPVMQLPTGPALVLRSARMWPGPTSPDESYLLLGHDYERPFAHPTHWAAFTCTGC